MNHLSAEEIFRSFFSPKPPYEISKPDDTGTDDAGHTRGPSNPPQNSAMSPLNTQNQQTNVQSRQASTTSNTTASNSKSRQPSTVSSTTAPSSEADRGTKRNWRGYVQLEPAAYSKQVHKANSYFDVDTSLDSRRSKRARLNRDEQHIVTPSTQSSRSSSSLSTAVNDDSEPERTFERLIADLKRSAPRTMATIRQRETTIEASGKPQSASRNPTARRKQTAKRLSALPKLPAFDHTRAAELIETLPVSPSGTTRNERVSESIERPQSATGMIDLPDEPDLPASDGAEDLSAVTKLPHFDHARAAELIETLPSSPSGTVESGHSTEDIERPKSAIGISRVSKRPKVSAPSAARYLPKVTELPQFDHACAAKLIKTLPLSPRGTEANERVVEEIERPKSAMGYISTEEIPLDASTAPPRPAADEPLYSPDSLPLIVDDDDESMSELEASVVPKRKNFSWKELRSLARAILAVDSPPPGFEDDEPTEDVSSPSLLSYPIHPSTSILTLTLLAVSSFLRRFLLS